MSSVSSIGSVSSPSASRASPPARGDPAAVGVPGQAREAPAAAPAPAPEPAAPAAGATQRLIEELARHLQEQSPQHVVSLQPGNSPNETVIVVRDRQTEQVIRQIPPEEMVALRDRMQEVLKEKGLLVDTIS